MKKEVEGDIVTRKFFFKFTDAQLNEINAAHMDATLMLEKLTEQVEAVRGSLLAMQAQKKEGGRKEDIECRVHYNHELGRVEYISVETEIIVAYREMVPDDRQFDVLHGVNK